MGGLTVEQVIQFVVLIASFISAIGIIMREVKKPIKSIEDKIEQIENKMDKLNEKVGSLETSMDSKLDGLEHKTEKISRDLKMTMMISKYLLEVSPDSSGEDIKRKFNNYIFDEATKEEGEIHGAKENR